MTLVDNCVIGIDPGGTTGIAVLLPMNLGYITCTTSTPEQLYEFLWAQDYSHLVVENFQAHKIDHNGLYTVDLVGACKAITYLKGAIYVKHMPQDRYAFKKAAREILKNRKVVIHEIEALEHLLRWEYDNARQSR